MTSLRERVLRAATHLWAMAAMVAFFSSPSSAHALICQANITGINISHKGAVLVSASGPGVSILDDALCTLGGDIGGKISITAEACKAMLVLLQGAMLSGREVIFWFEGGTCTPPAWVELWTAPYDFYHLKAL